MSFQYNYYFKPTGTKTFPEQTLLSEITKNVKSSYNTQMLDMITKTKYTNTITFNIPTNSLIKTIGIGILDIQCDALDPSYIQKSFNENPAFIVLKKNVVIGILTFTFIDNLINIDTICSKERGLGTKLMNYCMNIIRISIHKLENLGYSRYVKKIALNAISSSNTMKFYNKFKFKSKHTSNLKKTKKNNKSDDYELIYLENSNRSSSAKSSSKKNNSKSKSTSPIVSSVGIFNLPEITKKDALLLQSFDDKMERLKTVLEADIEFNKETNTLFTLDEIKQELIRIGFTDAEQNEVINKLNNLLK